MEKDLQLAARGFSEGPTKRSIRELAIDGWGGLKSLFKGNDKGSDEDESENDSSQPQPVISPKSTLNKNNQSVASPKSSDMTGFEGEMVPRSALADEQQKSLEIIREVENLQETLQQAQQQKYLIVHQFEADLEREKQARTAAEAGQLEAYELVGRTKHALEIAEGARRLLREQLDAAEKELQVLRASQTR